MRNPIRWIARFRQRRYERGYVAGWDDRQERVYYLEHRIDAARAELGVPGEGYPANVANAYHILTNALG